MKQFALLLSLCCILGASCSTRKARVATGTVTARQAKSIQHTSHAVVQATRTNSLAVWRNAVGERTRALVAEGNTDLAEIKKLVCEQTAQEELRAREHRLAWAELMHTVTLQTLKETSGGDVKGLTEQVDLKVKETMREALDKSFTESRNKLIEEHYREVMKETSRRRD